jgi:hypothetical protein
VLISFAVHVNFKNILLLLKLVTCDKAKVFNCPNAISTSDWGLRHYWIVYLADLNTTFKVDKKTDSILKAKDGRTPSLE